mmetsp:Transcript_24731/g.74208  ORF Transcript_24731/g.74208 Transcript_24731/m.74208 type:complete len:357 (-) Transcript_24731:45-1115(-)
MAAFQQLTDATVGVSCHAWSPDATQIAYAPNSNELRIADASTLATLHTMRDHDMVIAAIDWHPASNFIVTCSHDRNAFVWNYDEGEAAWKPSLVILRIERAALDVKWSPDGQKFAVASSAKCVPVCYYEQDNNWWVSKMIKKHKSTVLSLAWHPNSQIVATGSSDFRCRVFSAHVAAVDGEQTSGDFAAPAAFGEPYAEFPCSGWVHAVAYAPSGSTLAFAGHDASVHFVAFAPGAAPAVQTLKNSFLPLCQLLFTAEDTLVGAGHDANPCAFRRAGAWAFSAFLDTKTEKKAEAATNSVASKMAMWQNKDKTGTAAKTETSTAWLKHQGPITCLKATATGFSTSACDGRLVQWTV